MEQIKKRCSRCKEILPFIYFYRNKHTKDGYNGWCKKCVTEWRKEHYKDWLQEIKNDLYCKYCGESENCCLDFHHVNGEKDLGISSMVSQKVSKKKIVDEIDKCIVVCANCHRKIHSNIEFPS